jgi:hypothetical protein
MHFARKAQNAAHRDVGMADGLAEPPGAFPARPVFFERCECRTDLKSAALHPDIGGLLVQALLVEQADKLDASKNLAESRLF